MGKNKKVGILTGGGDCAGLNSIIKWAVKGLYDTNLKNKYKNNFEAIGIKRGWAGLVNVDTTKEIDPDNMVYLSEKDVRTWDRFGGTNLGSSRTNPYKSEESIKKLLNNVEKLELYALIAIGGEDTLGVAKKLKDDYNLRIVGVPKTIDKDLMGTDYSIGFETAVEVICQEIDRLRTSAGSHNRIYIVETMGRHAGHLAMQGGISGGACMVLIPEFEFDIEKVYEILMNRKKSGARYDIVVVAEGAKPKLQGEILQNAELDEFGHPRLGGIGEFIAKQLEKKGIKEVRSIVLSYLQRGGAPVAYDRRVGRAFGLAASELVHMGNFGKMVSLINNQIVSVPLENAIQKDEKGKTKLNLVNVDLEYDTERYIPKRSALGQKIY